MLAVTIIHHGVPSPKMLHYIAAKSEPGFFAGQIFYVKFGNKLGISVILLNGNILQMVLIDLILTLHTF